MTEPTNASGPAAAGIPEPEPRAKPLPRRHPPLKLSLFGEPEEMPAGAVENDVLPARRMTQSMLPIFGPDCPPPISPEYRLVRRPRKYQRR